MSALTQVPRLVQSGQRHGFKRAGPDDLWLHARDQPGADVTERRFVRRVRGGHPGLVTNQNERTVWVAGTADLE
jgi:predicted ribosome quality control (RQC) complex YloA/Tae2 family protein